MDKQVTIYVLDVSSSMGHVHKDRAVSDLDWAKQYVVDEMANRVLYNRVSDKVAVIVNNQDGPEEVLPITAPDRATVRAVQTIESESGAASFPAAILEALTSIASHCKKLKFTKKIVAITNSRFDEESVEVERIRQLSAEFNVSILLALIDSSIEPFKMLPEAIVVDYSTVAETIFASKPKVIKPVSLYNGLLTLGAEDKTQMGLEVSVFPAAKRATAPTAHWVYGSECQKVRQVHDALVDGELIEKSGLDMGYLYGSEIVLFDEKDRQDLLQAGGPQRYPGLEIIAFVDEIPAYVLVGSSNYVLAADDRSAIGLSALARAMYEREKVAVARFVRRKGSDIEVVSLEPFITQEAEGLLMTRLPFAQDCYSLLFNSLKNDERQPTDEMQAAMDSVIEDMELDPSEFDPQAIANPYNHRVANFIKQRALDLTDIPSVELLQPVESDLLQKSFVDLFDIQKVDRSATEAQDKENLESTAGNLDLDELLG